ncbi:shaker-related potassium channel tsha2-like [Rhopilema esculentum]|uniref:shaker-related potassium channel tsha2-like n=1 Tax=Rhopilema esculentum TaxID=499914 RepID=UPI0031DBA9AC
MAVALHYDMLNGPPEFRDRNWSGRSVDSPKTGRHEISRLRGNVYESYIHRKKSSVTSKPRVVVNVSGKRFETFTRTFTSKPNCLLSKKARSSYYNEDANEYFFDRNAKVFEALLTYLQTGILAKPDAVPDKVYLDDLRFFGFENEAVDFYKSLLLTIERPVFDLPKNKYQRKIWETMEYPSTSRLAKIISLISTFVIVVSIFVFCIETLPYFKEQPNGTSTEMSLIAKDVFMWIESICVAWFTIEYLLRLATCPRKFRFLYQPLNIVDLAAIVPFYVIVALEKTGTSLTSLAILRVLRLVRVFRIFKLSRYSKALQLLMQTLSSSVKELCLLLFLLMVITILFSSAFYYFETEGNPDTDFYSIPHTFWLSIVTLTTVGYGDMVPVTVGGRIVGALLAVTGVLVVALPIPIIVNNFSRIYTRIMSDSSYLDELACIETDDGELLIEDVVTSL